MTDGSWKALNELTLKLDLVLDDECLALIIDLLGELGRDGMMSRCVLDDKALVALHALVNMGFFYSPFSYICPLLILVGALCVLLGMGWLPSCLPIVCELLHEVTLDLGRLRRSRLAFQLHN